MTHLRQQIFESSVDNYISASDSSHSYLKMRDPICIFAPGRDAIYADLDHDGLLTEDLLGKKVVVISIAGRFRQGKSFLMNFVLKYLRAGGAPDWLYGQESEDLEGFDWRHTKNAVTKGVLIWPEVFKLLNASGEEVVVLLMDTQGVFDTKTTLKDSTSIFSLSVLLSSIQIFNMKQTINGDDLGNLQLFTEFGRLACSESSKGNWQSDQKPFQDLIFLVRDWPYPKQCSYGWDGGDELLEEELDGFEVIGELAGQRTCIKSCFERLRCFLMPHPGEEVDGSDEFRGHLRDIKKAFVVGMKSFIEDIFLPRNLKTKKIHNKEITLRDFLVYVKEYTAIMDDLPTPRSLFDATVAATNSAVVNNCFEMYETRVREVAYRNPQESDRFEELHDFFYKDALNRFNESRKMGDSRTIATALKDLEKRITNSKRFFTLVNSASYDRKKFEARSRELIAEQERLRSEIYELGDATGELSRKLANSEAERENVKRRERETAGRLQALIDKYEKSWCTIV